MGVDSGLPVPGYKPLYIPENGTLILMPCPSVCLACLKRYYHPCGRLSYLDGLAFEQYHAVLHRAHFFTVSSALPQTSHFAVLSLSKIALLVLSIASSV